METLELTVTTEDEARTQAAAQLGVDPSAVTVTVLSKKKGLFGRPDTLIVRAEAAKPAAAPAPTPVAAEEPAEAPAEEKPKRGRKTLFKKEEEPVDAEAPAAAEAEPEAEAEPAAKPARRTRAKKEAAEAPAEGSGEAAEAPESKESKDDRDDVVATDEDAEKVVELLNALMEAGDLKVEAVAQGVNGRYVNVSLEGKDTGYMIGKKGEVLNAFQYLANVIVSRNFEKNVRVVLDGNDFRAKRSEILIRQANEIAEQVKEKGLEAVLDPLPAFERRVVHNAIAELEGVQSYSEGEEPNRRVVIAPAD
ncbi:MAG: KH domain-containing protein [Fimbriimonadaceae bacterium]|nr:KH domain-containing protein [Fimbriimonadaceae bacterium]